MIDYIKAYFNDKNQVFENVHSAYTMNHHHYFRFDEKTQKMIQYNTYFKKFHNLNFKITNKTGFVQNSLHCLFNNINGATINRNDNDFSYSNLLTSLDFVQNISDYPLDEMNISEGLEFGFNLEVPFDVDDFILNSCVLLKYKPLDNTDIKTLISFTNGYCRLKIYNKAKQFSLPKSLLRIELKFIDKRAFNKLGIFTLADLAEKDNLYKIYEVMHNLINEHLMVVDNIAIRNFSDYKNKKLHRFCSSKFWNELPKSQLKFEKERCKKALSKNNLLVNKKILLSLMEAKFYELIDK